MFKSSCLDPLHRETDKLNEAKQNEVKVNCKTKSQINKSRDVCYEYRLGGKVLLKSKGPKGSQPYEGPYKILGITKNRLFIQNKKKPYQKSGGWGKRCVVRV